jgi:hypothetical protein
MWFVLGTGPCVSFNVVKFIAKGQELARCRRTCVDPGCDTSSACYDERADEQARADIAKRSTEMACYHGVFMLEH